AWVPSAYVLVSPSSSIIRSPRSRRPCASVYYTTNTEEVLRRPAVDSAAYERTTRQDHGDARPRELGGVGAPRAVGGRRRSDSTQSVSRHPGRASRDDQPGAPGGARGAPTRADRVGPDGAALSVGADPRRPADAPRGRGGPPGGRGGRGRPAGR